MCRRNGKHVKVNGNLIIHSVLASEKAVAHKASNGQSVKDRKEISVAIARYLSPPGMDLNSKETLPPDAPLPQWFREGMEGKQAEPSAAPAPASCRLPKSTSPPPIPEAPEAPAQEAGEGCRKLVTTNRHRNTTLVRPRHPASFCFLLCKIGQP